VNPGIRQLRKKTFISLNLGAVLRGFSLGMRKRLPHVDFAPLGQHLSKRSCENGGMRKENIIVCSPSSSYVLEMSAGRVFTLNVNRD
jgi:hypothetical protein